MFRELPLFLGVWFVGLSMLLMPSIIVSLFGKEVDED